MLRDRSRPFSNRWGAARRSNLLPSGSKVMVLGHSFVTANQSTSPARPGPLTNITSKLGGVGPWIRSFDQRFNMDTWADVAAPYKTAISNNDVSGACNGFSGATLFDLSTTSGLLDYYLDREPAIIVLQLGTNDVSSVSSTLSDMQGWATDIFDRILARDIYLIAETIYPRVASGGVSPIPDGDSRLDKLTGYNSWLRGLSRQKFYVSDIASVLGEPRPNQSYWLLADGLHPQEKAVRESQRLILPLLQGLVSAGTYAPYNPDPSVSNILPNAAMSGTSGTKISGGGGPTPTGTVPTNYQVSNFAGGSSYACSTFSSDVTGYSGLRVDITVTSDATAVHEMRVSQTASVTLATLGLAVGDWLQWCQTLEVSAYAGWRGFNATVPLGDSTTSLWTTSIDFATNSTLYLLPSDATTRVMISEPFQIPSGVDRVRLSGATQFSVRFDSSVAGSPYIKISKPCLRKVSSPLTAWNL